MEKLRIVGYGGNRDAALADAKAQAAIYYGDLKHDGRPVRAWVEERETAHKLGATTPDYVTLTFAVEMEYRRP